jgi:hypothetical protein
MAGKGFRLSWRPTTVGGTISESMSSWTQLVNGSVNLKQAIIKANGNVSFDFKIISPTGNTIYGMKGNNLEFNDAPNLVLQGLYTFVIENCAPGDATFEGEFMFEEKKNK